MYNHPNFIKYSTSDIKPTYNLLQTLNSDLDSESKTHELGVNPDLLLSYTWHTVKPLRTAARLTCAIPVTETDTPNLVYTIGLSTVKVMVFKFILYKQHKGKKKLLIKFLYFKSMSWSALNKCLDSTLTNGISNIA